MEDPFAMPHYLDLSFFFLQENTLRQTKKAILSEQLEWRHLFYRGAPKSSKNKENILRTYPLVRNFSLKVAANF